MKICNKTNNKVVFIDGTKNNVYIKHMFRQFQTFDHHRRNKKPPPVYEANYPMCIIRPNLPWEMKELHCLVYPIEKIRGEISKFAHLPLLQTGGSLTFLCCKLDISATSYFCGSYHKLQARKENIITFLHPTRV